MSNPEFYVYYHNFNEDKIETFDVIPQIKPFILKNKKYYWDKEQFQKELNAEIMSRYWCKSEWEVIVSAWVGGNAECKIDVYHQIKNNWTLFWRMCWEIYTGLE